MFPSKDKKTDYEALESPFMRIPNMKIEVARALLDLGFRDLFELSGRSPDWIFEQMQQKNPPVRKVPELLQRLRIAVYFAENDSPEPRLLKTSAWYP
jgi:hypothetical protein